MSPRRRSLVLLALGAVCLAPVLTITIAYFAHIWSSPWGVSSDWPLLAVMSLVYLSMVGGPLMVTASALVMLRAARGSRLPLNCVFVGGMVSAAWSTFFVVVNPPDWPVKIMAWVMVLSSATIVFVSYRWLRHPTNESDVVS